ncbi:MAG: ABC transporter permease [Gemmatimonadota bacterium]
MMRRSTAGSVTVLAALVIGAALVPLFATTDPLSIEELAEARLIPPLGQNPAGDVHLAGTDRFGRDLLVRAFLAARVSLLVGVAGSIFAAALGIAIGLISGSGGRVVDRILMSVTDAVLAIPRLVLLLLCVALWRPGLATVVVVLVATGWMSVARLVRGEVRGLRGRNFIEAARTLGTPRHLVLLRHILPNALGPAIVAATLGVGNAILLESGLAFLGLGVQPPTPSWGNMIAGGRDLIVIAPWVALVPGLFLVIAVLCCTQLGDALRDRLAGHEGVTLIDR